MPPQKVSKSTAKEHASSSKSTATEHAGSTSDAKDPRLENMFQEACANAPPKIRCLLQEVSALGHYPKRYKQPQNKDERDSNSLAKKLTQARSSLNPAADKYLEAMKATLEAMQAASIEQTIISVIVLIHGCSWQYLLTSPSNDLSMSEWNLTDTSL